MLNDTIIEFDPTPRLYQPALSLHDRALAAIHIRADGRPDRILAAAQTWPAPIDLWLNVPPGALIDPDLPVELGGMLRHAGLAPERISLELPEAEALATTHDGLLRLSALRDIGIGLILTEFGEAIASLTALRRLPLTALKLSRTLVHGVPTDPEGTGLVGAAIAAAHVCGLAVIADGIANLAQSAWLAGQGCSIGLGPLFAAPMSARRLDGWLRGT